MKNLRKSLASVALLALMSWGSVATGQVSLGVTLPGVSIGINLPLYPQLVQVLHKLLVLLRELALL